MTDKQTFYIAEWLLHNADTLKHEMKDPFKKAKIMKRSDAINYLYDQILYKTKEYNNKFSFEELSKAFSDERVKIIIDKYYMKEFIYEH